MRKKEKELLIGIGTIIVIVIGSFIYKHIVEFTLIIIGIVFISLFIGGLYYLIEGNSYSYYGVKNDNYNKILGFFLLFLALFPGYFMGYIMFNYQESEKYLQEKSIDGITGLGKAAFAILRPKAFIGKEIKKEFREDLRENNQNIINEVNVTSTGVDLEVNYNN